MAYSVQAKRLPSVTRNTSTVCTRAVRRVVEVLNPASPFSLRNCFCLCVRMQDLVGIIGAKLDARCLVLFHDRDTSKQ